MTTAHRRLHLVSASEVETARTAPRQKCGAVANFYGVLSRSANAAYKSANSPARSVFPISW